MNDSIPTVSVIIPCRNEAKYIESCLNSVLTQKEPPGGFEVIVADGMSDDGTRDILKQFALKYSNLLVVDNIQKHTSSALNLAIKRSRGSVIIRMDAHHRFAEDYIVKSVETLQATGCDNVGGAMFLEGNTYIQSAIANAFHSPFAVGGATWHNPNYEGFVDTVFGGVFNREAFEKYGYFDEELVRNQDDEFNLRIVRNGGKIWQSPKIRSWYTPRNSLISLFKQYRQYGYWKVRVIQKHKLPASIRHLVPGLFVFSLILTAFLSAIGFLGSLFSDNAILSFLLKANSLTFSSILSLYISFIATASVLTVRRTTWKFLPILPTVFFCYHVGYGLGFLEGLLDFVIFKRKSATSKTALTR